MRYASGPIRQGFVSVLLTSACLVCSAANDKPRPNIIVLVADDWGYTDVGAYGSEIATPNLDELAKHGARFSNFHVAAVCSPTRSMLLTGVDNHRNGVGNMPETMPAEHEGQPGYAGTLNDNAVTLATMLKDNGYHTYITGKWHLGKTPDKLPGNRGFERSFIQADSGSDNWEKRTYMMLYDKAYWFEQGREAGLPADYYSSKFFVDKAIEYIAASDRDKKPFFAYIGFQANHIPLQAPAEFVQKYRGRYDQGWTALRQARRDRSAALGLIPPGTDMVALASTTDWDRLTVDKKRQQARHMEVYAGMAEAMDFQVGRLLAHLKASGQYDNTVFVFLSDNGSDPADPLNIPASSTWVRMNYDTDADPPGGKGTFSANGPSWASATNSPLNGYKYFAGEGGLRVPLIISGVPGMPLSRTIKALTHVNDIVPTLLDVAGIKPHDGTYRGNKVEPLSGRSMLPMLQGKTDYVHASDEALGYELAGSAALFKGDYKLVKNIAPLGDGQWRLYDLKTDPGEVHDLGSSQPERFKSMLIDYEEYVRANGVLPIPQGFDLQKTAMRYAVWHFLVPKLKAAWPWAIPGLVLFFGGLLLAHRRRTRMIRIGTEPL
ncbi:MAG: arylsulfatase [Comamonadaceae bacterium]|nr:MAG: arylsulfatase [Comamonadaceae bacterium]